MNEKKLIEETVGGSIERIKKELVHILVDDEEIKSLIISECGFILKERLAEELEKIKAEIREWYWQADKQKLSEDACVVDAMTDLFIRTINEHISEMKGE